MSQNRKKDSYSKQNCVGVLRAFFWAAVAGLLIFPPAISGNQTDEAIYGDVSKPLPYVIGIDDRIHVFVWQHPELSVDTAVRPDGKISFPLLDEVDGAGLSLCQLDDALTKRLAEFIKTPQVTVSILEFKSRRIAVLGEVQRPGVFPLTGNLTLLEAVALADHAKQSAELKSVLLIRSEPNQKPNIVRINLKKQMSHPEVAWNNVVLQDKDVIFIPKSFVSKLDDFLEFFTRKVQPVINLNYNKSVQ